jgi:uncharacterized repeat protein (TIGR04138 family)
LPISFDLLCTQCQYNLRGLILDGKCPECSQPVSDSFKAAMAEDPESCWDMAVALKRQWVDDAMSAAGYPPDAGLFLIGALQMTRLQSQQAKDVCNAFRDYAAWYFNDQNEAVDLLNEWRLKSSEDVGRVIGALADAGLIEVDANQSRADFAGLFRLENLFAAPEPVRKG